MCVAASKIKAVDRVLVRHLISRLGLPPVEKTDRQTLQAEARLFRALRRAFDGVETSMVRELLNHGIPNTNASRRRFADRMLRDALEEMAETTVRHGVGAAEMGRRRAVGLMQQGGMSVAFEAFSERVENQLSERIMRFSQSTASRILGDVRDNLTRSYRDGLGIDDAAWALRSDIRDLRDHRMRTIARTEINTAQNEGAHQTLHDYGVEYEQWITSLDGREREAHNYLHGTVVRVGERFPNGLRYPGDRESGILEEFINCRCRAVPYILGPNEVITSTPYIP